MASADRRFRSFTAEATLNDDRPGARLGLAAAMGWEILWPLILGFTLSACVQAVVSHEEMSRLLPDDRPKSILRALALGAASSSCSYALSR